MILSVGEILVDIFKQDDIVNTLPGGAPFNVAANIKGFKGDVSFMGAIGDDTNGRFLSNFAKSCNFNELYLDVVKTAHTSEAVVTLTNGERSFRFNRDNGADYQLSLEKFKALDFSKLHIIHFGSLMVSHKSGLDFLRNAIKYVKENTKCLISFDVNYRDDIFSSEDEAKAIYLDILKDVDILKLTEEELALLSNKDDISCGIKEIINDHQLLALSLGKEGSLYYYNGVSYKVSSIKVTPVDTTGAGDAFYSYVLYELDKLNHLDLSKDEVNSIFKKANIVGALCTQKKGAINSAPTLKELKEFLRHEEA